MNKSSTSPEPLAFHETVETPEQVQLHFELAGLGTRSIAFLLDGLLRYGVLVGIAVLIFLIFTFGWAGSLDTFFASTSAHAIIVGIILLYFSVEWGYFALFEWWWNGQTPGKRAVHIRVLKDGGGPISFLDAALRNLLRPIDSSGPLAPVGIMFVFFNAKHKRPGDLVARTIVVRERPKTLAQVLAEPVTRAALPNSPFLDLLKKIPLAPSEHEMINRFLQRRTQLDPNTRRRLAQQVAGVIIEKAKAASTNPNQLWPTLDQSEQFLEDLIAFHQQQAGPAQ